MKSIKNKKDYRNTCEAIQRNERQVPYFMPRDKSKQSVLTKAKTDTNATEGRKEVCNCNVDHQSKGNETKRALRDDRPPITCCNDAEKNARPAIATITQRY